MTNWSDEHQQMIDDCITRESRLNEWEQTFIDSLSRQLDNDNRPTIKQIETLNNIWESATARG